MAYVKKLQNYSPKVGSRVFLAPTASITGNVVLGDDSSVFYGASLRGDLAPIKVGSGSNLQDNSVLHADPGHPCSLGAGVTVGHGAVVHGAAIGDNCLIGMSATIMNGASVGEDCLVAAGALLLEGAQVPPRSLVSGVPGKVRRQLSEEEVEKIRLNAGTYMHLKDIHLAAMNSDAE